MQGMSGTQNHCTYWPNTCLNPFDFQDCNFATGGLNNGPVQVTLQPCSEGKLMFGTIMLSCPTKHHCMHFLLAPSLFTNEYAAHFREQVWLILSSHSQHWALWSSLFLTGSCPIGCRSQGKLIASLTAMTSGSPAAV